MLHCTFTERLPQLQSDKGHLGDVVEPWVWGKELRGICQSFYGGSSEKPKQALKDNLEKEMCRVSPRSWAAMNTCTGSWKVPMLPQRIGSLTVPTFDRVSWMSMLWTISYEQREPNYNGRWKNRDDGESRAGRNAIIILVFPCLG